MLLSCTELSSSLLEAKEPVLVGSTSTHNIIISIRPDLVLIFQMRLLKVKTSSDNPILFRYQGTTSELISSLTLPTDGFSSQDYLRQTYRYSALFLFSSPTCCKDRVYPHLTHLPQSFPEIRCFRGENSLSLLQTLQESCVSFGFQGSRLDQRRQSRRHLPQSILRHFASFL